MSDPAEMLAMLAIHGIDLQHVPGGIPTFVALDVAGALGMMHDQPAAAMLMAKYMLDMRATETFRDHWRLVVDRRAYVERWNHDQRAELLAAYSLAEWLDAQRCRTCKGTRRDMTSDGKVIDCAACDGVGLRKIGDRPVARGLDMSNEGYRKSSWPYRIGWARSELQRREIAALAGLGRRLTGRHLKAQNS